MSDKAAAIERARKLIEGGKIVIPTRVPVLPAFHPKSDAYLALKEAIG